MNNIGLVLVSPLVRCRRLDSQITICDSESDRDVAYTYERVLAHAVVRPMRKTAPCSLGAPVNEQASSSSSSSPVHTGCLRLPRHSTTAAPRFYVLLFLSTLLAVAVGTRRRQAADVSEALLLPVSTRHVQACTPVNGRSWAGAPSVQY